MKVLVACEYSGRTRDAFLALGHDAISCDLLPSESPGPHIQADVLPILREPWDLVIAHPPCTYIANSGVRWRVEREEWDEIRQATGFFLECLNANAPRVAVENPVMARKYTGIRKPDFSVHPWHFGDKTKKRTCFWIRGLAPLVPDAGASDEGATPDIHMAAPSPDRWKFRSRTFPGIARAMAEQWGTDQDTQGDLFRA